MCALRLSRWSTAMATGQLVFAQLMGMLPWSSFDRLVKLHRLPAEPNNAASTQTELF
jgi:hypothetical protein